MRTRELGRTGLRVSVLGFGAGALGDHYFPTEEADNRAAVRHALDRGINLIDTSPFYSRTRSEEILGSVLADVPRDEVVLCTKAGRNTAKAFDFSAAAMARSLEASLRRLRTDYVDVWYAHDIEFASDYEQVFTETAAALDRAKEQGKCRFIGMTGYPLALLAQAIERCRLDVVLSYCHFSPANLRLLSELLPVAGRHGVAVVNGSPLMMGLLSGKGPPRWHPAPEPLKAACRRVVELCQARGVDPATLALQFVLREPRVPVTLVGMSTAAEVDVNLRALDGGPDEDLLAEVLATLEPVKDVAWVSGFWPAGR
jgi:L-galactose dehydrogenase